MKKNILALVTVILASVILATPFVGTSVAKKTEIVITRMPGVDPPTEVFLETVPRVERFLSNGVRVASGTFITVAYGSEEDDRGPLGYGTKYVEAIISVEHSSGEIVTTSMGDSPMYVHGFGIYKVKYVIEGGPFGAGTLEGTERMEWKVDLSAPNPLNWIYEMWSSYSIKQATGDFAGVRADLETYYNPLVGYYHTKTTIIY